MSGIDRDRFRDWDRLMDETDYGRVALRTFAPVSDDFRIYRAAWLGDFPNPHGMEVTGAEFRRAKAGKNKGRLCIKVKGTDRTTYVSAAAMDAERDARKAAQP